MFHILHIAEFNLQCLCTLDNLYQRQYQGKAKGQYGKGKEGIGKHHAVDVNQVHAYDTQEEADHAKKLHVFNEPQPETDIFDLPVNVRLLLFFLVFFMQVPYQAGQ